MNQELRGKLGSQTVDQMVVTHQEQLKDEYLTQIKKRSELYEQSVREELEIRAKQALDTVIQRFTKPAPMERGIGLIDIKGTALLNVLKRNQEEMLLKLPELLQVELKIAENDILHVLSFDPLKRKTAINFFEIVLSQKNPEPLLKDPAVLYKKSQAEIEKIILRDGEYLAQELGLKDFHPEIKRVLGILRYRYSYAQNQFFHVGEVGWFAGLLASEIGFATTKTARQSGVLHDIGKAMDHEKEGGHAVIGADFIKQYNISPEVEYAVRAHHYEVQPDSPLDFAVIGADAISGARPGARRQTVNLYNQKVEAMSSIAESYNGVNRSLVLNGGRELRVIVDSRAVSDKRALELSSLIAGRIETECSYPGQIRVVILRETYAEAYAK